MLRSHFANASRFAPTFSWMTASDNCYVLLSRCAIKPFCFGAVHKRGLICFEVSSHFVPRSFPNSSRHDFPRRSAAGPSLRICSPLIANWRSMASSCDSRPVRISVWAAITATTGWLCCQAEEEEKGLVKYTARPWLKEVNRCEIRFFMATADEIWSDFYAWSWNRAKFNTPVQSNLES